MSYIQVSYMYSGQNFARSSMVMVPHMWPVFVTCPTHEFSFGFKNDCRVAELITRRTLQTLKRGKPFEDKIGEAKKDDANTESPEGDWATEKSDCPSEGKADRQEEHHYDKGCYDQESNCGDMGQDC